MLPRTCIPLAGIALLAAALPAQRPVALGVAGGVSLPTGALGDGAQAGWHALATLALATPKQALGLRVDGAYHRFDFADDAATLATGARTLASATGNVTYRLPMTDSPLSPYVITGLGAYRIGCTDERVCDATTRFGWNAGLGTKWYVRGVRGFVEARYHRTSRDEGAMPHVPLTFGILL